LIMRKMQAFPPAVDAPGLNNWGDQAHHQPGLLPCLRSSLGARGRFLHVGHRRRKRPRNQVLPARSYAPVVRKPPRQCSRSRSAARVEFFRLGCSGHPESGRTHALGSRLAVSSKSQSSLPLLPVFRSISFGRAAIVTFVPPPQRDSGVRVSPEVHAAGFFPHMKSARTARVFFALRASDFPKASWAAKSAQPALAMVLPPRRLQEERGASNTLRRPAPARFALGTGAMIFSSRG